MSCEATGRPGAPRLRMPAPVAREGAIAGAGAVAVYLLARRLELFEGLYALSRAHEAWQVDELLPLAVYLMVALGAFAVRRAREAGREIARRRAAEAELARLHEAAVRRAEQLAVLNRLSRSLSLHLDLPAVAREIVAAVEALVPGAASRLWDLRGDEPDSLEVLASTGLQDPRGGTVRFRRHEGLAGEAVASRRPVVSPDLLADPRFINKAWAAKEGLVSAILLPLFAGERAEGILAIMLRARHDFAEEEIALLQALADHAAIAVSKARLHAAVQAQARELEARVKQRTAELEQALQVKVEFLARMSHELRTPLNFILGFAELLRNGTAGGLTPKQAHFVERIHLGGKQLLELITDILDFAEPGGGRGLRLESLPLASLVREAVELQAVQAAQKQLSVRQDIEPAMSLVADRRKLLQILGILLGNAVKFTPAGGRIRVSAGVIPEARTPGAGETGEEAGAECVRIAVENTGVTISAEDRERIFQGFEQVDGSATRAHPGAGIGLALVRALVEMHGGRVRADSGAQQGVAMVVEFPRLPLPPARRVLIVEDQEAFLRALAVFLEHAGYAVEVACRGEEALARIAARPPDLLVLDLGLPEMEGLHVLRSVRAGAATLSLPVLVLTGPGEGIADEAKALGADEFLAKPTSPSAVVRIVRDLFERKAVD